jgi:hypothetical protein
MKQLLLIIIIFLNLPAAAQKRDTVRAILHITNSKLKSLQHVAGYVIIENKKVVGYLTRRKKEFPRKVEVWGYN